MTTLESFFDDYAATFARYDTNELAAMFGFPLHIVNVTEQPTAASIESRDEWLPVLDSLLESYRRIGVATGARLEFEIREVMPAGCSVRVRWELRRPDGSKIYDFTAIYTIVTVDSAWHIFAIVHDELPRLGEALASCEP